MRISDWSSDVCSSDLTVIVRVMPALCRKLLARAMEAAAAADDAARVDADRAATGEQRRERIDRRPILGDALGGDDHDAVADIEIHIEIGRAACRESGVQYV